MRAFLARLLRSLTSTTLSAQLAGMLIGGILFLHGVATFTVQLVEERQAARSALLEQANSLALSLQLLHSEPFEYKRSLLERLERLDVVHLSLSDAPNPARQARDERALYLRDRLRKNLNSIETDLDTREMLTEVQRVHVADSMNPTLRRHVPWTHVYESRVSVRLDDGKWLCVVISSDAYDFSPSQASLTMLLLEAGLLILLILVVVHRVVRPLRVLSGKAESFGRDLYTAPLPEDGPTEVREAARAFNKMQERIRAGVGQHERILAAVAHDLRTPLTRIRLRVESMDPASPLRAKLLGDIDILGGIMANSAELTRGSARDEAAVRMDMNACWTAWSPTGRTWDRTSASKAAVPAPGRCAPTASAAASPICWTTPCAIPAVSASSSGKKTISCRSTCWTTARASPPTCWNRSSSPSSAWTRHAAPTPAAAAWV